MTKLAKSETKRRYDDACGLAHALELVGECDTLGYFGYWPVLYHRQDWFDEPVTQLVETWLSDGPQVAMSRFNRLGKAGPAE